MIASQFQPLANHLWQSTLFAAVAGLLTLALRNNRAQTRYWLWLAASVKFLIPFSILAAAGGHLGRHVAVTGAQSGLSSVIEQVGEPFVINVSPAAAKPWSVDLIPALLCGGWGIGFAILVRSGWVRWRRIRRALRGASPAIDLEIDLPVLSSAAFFEPGVWGIFRPVLLLPEGIAQHLTPAQLEAILTHELCHVRRRDNLAAAVHMAVEAVFWFHPLVWWLGARLLEERERACDEEVLRLGNDPRVYAEGILKICELGLDLHGESSLRYVAGVTGGNLTKRIEAIMANRMAQKLTWGRKIVLATAGMAALAAPIGAGMMNAPSLLILPRPPVGVAQVRAQMPTPAEEAPEASPAPAIFSKPRSGHPDRAGLDELERSADADVPTRQLTGWSGWKQSLAEKHDPMSDQRSFVGDPQFEYRWRPEWAESGYACAVEVRPAGDADKSYRVPEIDIMYLSPDRTYAAPDVPIGRRPSQMHYFATLGVAIGSKLRHANFSATDCERVFGVAAGHFGPNIGLPVF